MYFYSWRACRWPQPHSCTHAPSLPLWLPWLLLLLMLTVTLVHNAATGHHAGHNHVPAHMHHHCQCHYCLLLLHTVTLHCIQRASCWPQPRSCTHAPSLTLPLLLLLTVMVVHTASEGHHAGHTHDPAHMHHHCQCHYCCYCCLLLRLSTMQPKGITLPTKTTLHTSTITGITITITTAYCYGCPHCI